MSSKQEQERQDMLQAGLERLVDAISAAQDAANNVWNLADAGSEMEGRADLLSTLLTVNHTFFLRLAQAKDEAAARLQLKASLEAALAASEEPDYNSDDDDE